MEKSTAIAQYKSFSEHRLHFSRLYFSTVAFVIIISIGLISVELVMFYNASVNSALLMFVAVFMIFGGFITYRLKYREECYAKLISEIENACDEMVSSPTADGKGARFLVVVAMVIGGVIAGIYALFTFFNC